MKIVSVDVMQVPSGNAGASRGDWSPRHRTHQHR